LSDPKRQHTIPRVYLENFKDEDGRLSVFSKRRRELLRPKPDDALIRKYYYSQPVEGAPNAEHVIETRLLNDLETRYPALYSQLCGETDIDLDLLFKTLLMMRSRSPAFREAFELGLADLVDDQRRSIPPSLLESAPEEIPDIWDKLVVTIDPHRSLIAMAHYIREYTDGITSCSFSIMLAPRGAELITSDNPVIWFEKGRKARAYQVYPNMASRNTRLIFPLDKRRLLVGRQRKDEEPLVRKQVRMLSRRELHEANMLQLGCAWDDVVGKLRLPKNDFDYYSQVAPKLVIKHFDPDRDEFFLDETRLDIMRTKPKFSPR